MPPVTRDAGTDPQTGRAEQVCSEKPGLAIVHDDQSHPTVPRQVWGLARKASQWVRSSEGCGWAQDKLQHSSRDKMQRLSLNVPPRKEVECLQQGFFTAVTWLFPQPPDPRLPYHSRTSFGHGKPIPIPEVCAEHPGTGLCALLPGNTETWAKSVSYSIKHMWQVSEKKVLLKNQMYEVKKKNNLVLRHNLGYIGHNWNIYGPGKFTCEKAASDS